jgi:hypothetical protein
MKPTWSEPRKTMMSAKPRCVGEAAMGRAFPLSHCESFDRILRARTLSPPAATRNVSSSRLMPRSPGSTLTSAVRESLLDQLALLSLARRMVTCGRKRAVVNLSVSSAHGHVLVSTSDPSLMHRHDRILMNACEVARPPPDDEW